MGKVLKMGKVISLWHKIVQQEFDLVTTSLTYDIMKLDQTDINYTNSCNKIIKEYEEKFYSFKKRILSLGYNTNHYCECNECKLVNNTKV